MSPQPKEVFMQTLSVTLSAALKERLEALAVETGKTVDECLTLAVAEFVDNWEIHMSDLHQIDDNEARTVLNAGEE
jgi:predicted transcriptional regulator